MSAPKTVEKSAEKSAEKGGGKKAAAFTPRPVPASLKPQNQDRTDPYDLWYPPPARGEGVPVVGRVEPGVKAQVAALVASGWLWKTENEFIRCAVSWYVQTVSEHINDQNFRLAAQLMHLGALSARIAEKVSTSSTVRRSLEDTIKSTLAQGDAGRSTAYELREKVREMVGGMDDPRVREDWARWLTFNIEPLFPGERGER